MIRPGPLLLRSTSAAATRAAAAVLATLSRPGDVLLLSGGLGAGKTTFAQGFGAGLGVREAITSPTFTLVRQYPVDRHPVTAFIHADVYRLDHLGEVVELGLGELVGDTGVALVEWGDVAEPVLGKGALTVRLEPDPDHDDHRRITVGPADSWSDRWAALQHDLAGWRWGR
ncbi:MAG TPA: tRNA (adenosine(37)-N6)-threonylcarbamoyltransferase complex ATPase subunit type 1 TsaE [Acidimicrobiales bacterium]|nr:tRNA (adenosine(37)-N6)-threonylcarbamoyltransferase complex ATPase subunit type 1 TsaE [Acidimicrobiales bacterium]